MRLGKFYQISPDNWHFLNYVAGDQDLAERYLQQRRSLHGAERRIEEFVRQWAIAQIVDQYDYPQFWLGNQLTIEEPVWIGATRCRADIALKNRTGDPIVYIETKTYGVSALVFHGAEQQLKSYLSATYTALLGMVTDGVRTTIIRKRSGSNNFESIPDLPSLKEALRQNIFSQEDIQITLPTEEKMDGGEGQEVEGLPMPAIDEYKTALLSLSPYITDNQRALLRAHYNSPGRTATMTELAHAVGYPSFRAANLQYGKLATRLCEHLDWHYGVKINILVSFIPPQRANGNQWQLIMRPEVVKALEAIKWV